MTASGCRLELGWPEMRQPCFESALSLQFGTARDRSHIPEATWAFAIRVIASLRIPVGEQSQHIRQRGLRLGFAKLWLSEWSPIRMKLR